MEPIYEIITNTENISCYTFEIKLNSDHPIFKGHFPGNPIVPGVVFISIIKELIESNSILNVGKLKIRSSRSIKFLRPVIPGSDLLQFKIEISEEKQLTISAEVFAEGFLCVKMDAKAEVV